MMKIQSLNILINCLRACIITLVAVLLSFLALVFG